MSLEGSQTIAKGFHLMESSMCWMEKQFGVNLVRTNEAYVLDMVAGLGQWTQCASMIQARQSFGFGVMDGKIHIFEVFFLSDLGSHVNVLTESKAYGP